MKSFFSKCLISLCILVSAHALAITPTEVAKLLASDGTSDDHFGTSVAVDGDTSIIGAVNSDGNTSHSGSAYIFRRVADTWSEQALLTARDGAFGDKFGISVAIEGDTAIIGAYSDNNENGQEAGSVYVFVRTAGIWNQQAKLIASDGAPHDQFGGSVAINNNTIVIGALLDDDNGDRSGSAYVFERTGDQWSECAKLTPSDGDAGDLFTFSRSISIDGDTILIGAAGDGDNGEQSGSAYIFIRNAGSWSEHTKLTASDGEAFDFFGRSTAISGDAAIIGATGDDDNGSASGSVYLFERTDGVWYEEMKLTSSDGQFNDAFGQTVTLDGDKAVIGAPNEDAKGGNSGSAYVFGRNAGIWSEQAKLTASDGVSFDQFSSSISQDGNTVLVGAPLHNDIGLDSGSSYVYSLAQTATLSTTSAMVTQNPQRVEQGNVTLSADFDAPIPEVNDDISVDFDGISLINAPFSAFKQTEEGNVYMLSEQQLLVRIDFDAHTILAKNTCADLTPVDNDNGVDVEVRYGNTVGVEHFLMEMISSSLLKYYRPEQTLTTAEE